MCCLGITKTNDSFFNYIVLNYMLLIFKKKAVTHC